MLSDLAPDNVLYAAATCADSGVFGLPSFAVFLLPSPSSQPSQTVFSDDSVSGQKQPVIFHTSSASDQGFCFPHSLHLYSTHCCNL